MVDKKQNVHRRRSVIWGTKNHPDLDEQNDPFEKIMERVGDHDRFQRIYNLAFVLALGSAGSMVYMNIILALDIPEHWCLVPGQELTNYSLNEWRRLTLPMQKDNRGSSTFSSCLMYNASFTDADNLQHWNKTKPNVTECQHGWSYDLTWYDSTIASKENWVCSKDLYVTNVFVVARIAEVIGSFVLGQMGDIYGRRIVYYISVVFCVLGRSLSTFVTKFYWTFIFLTGLTGVAVNSLFQSPQIVGMEISREQDRSKIAIYQNCGWSIGTSFMPLLFWCLRDWVSFMWVTTLPTAIILIFYKYAVESPRWLISKHRYGEAITQLKKIAKINGRRLNLTEKDLTRIYAERTDDEPIFGMASLFSGWHLTRNTTIMSCSWCVVTISYFTLVLLSTHMGGNPFLNFALQSVIEIPAYVIGRYIYMKYEIIMIGASSFIKFLNALTFYTVSLQSMELYPTCIRQTGIALSTIVSNAFGILAPYILYLGVTIDIRVPYCILGALFFVGCITALFLPETLHKKLPDTMEEARNFGMYDKFFSLPKLLPQTNEPQSPEEVKLN
ncbi:beta-alanine transporter-like isoform X2 [Eurosta solidaginis]|uniref:beta-alanine transporter-like isoform X2 n=1 Tax=Eurosta solidaginis TaxID=178769 RepID=UPI0035312726